MYWIRRFVNSYRQTQIGPRTYLWLILGIQIICRYNKNGTSEIWIYWCELEKQTRKDVEEEQSVEPRWLGGGCD